MSFQYHRGRGRGRLVNSKSAPQENDGITYRTKKIQEQPSINISHDNNCCSELNITLDLNENELLFIKELKNMFNLLKKSPPVVEKLHQYFNTSDNPYIAMLKLIYNCQEFYSVKSKTLPMLIAEEFKSWAQSYRNKISHLLTPELKVDAFKLIIKQNSSTLTKLIFDIFEMIENRELFLNVIKCMIDKKKYKEACQYASLLALHENFTVHDFLVPLVLQDKLVNVDEFLGNSPKHQSELVEFLDSVLSSTSVRSVMGSYIEDGNIPDVKFDKVHAKPWKKLIARLVKMFKISSDLTPNLNKRRNEGALQFLLHKRFIENSFGDESWKEMVQEAVGDDEYLQRELIVLIAQYGEFAEALRWANFYKIDRKDWPYSVRMLEENPDNDRAQQRPLEQHPEDDSWEDETQKTVDPIEYHSLALDTSAINLVDTPIKFEDFLDTGLQDVDIVGIDCEWKPSFGGNPNELALMQISTRSQIFVLDIVNLANKTPHLWQELGKFLFNNCDILKLGFSLTGDIHMIRQALPNLNFSTKQVGFLDLCSLWKHLEKFPNIVLPYEVQSGGPSLSTLVQICLGKPLDKSEQFSNWEKRPLRRSQVEYAALDAYCLVEVYDILRKCCVKEDVPFDEICYSLMTNEKVHKKKPKRNPNKRNQVKDEPQQPPSPHANSVGAHEIKVVCDTMLQGLGKNLRRCGIDTVILENNQDHKECVRYAQNDNRYIITRSGPFKMLNGYVCSGHCLKIISDNLDEQLQQVLDYYKVNVTKKHVFSRCQACNGNNFVKLSRSTMHAVFESSSNRGSCCVPPPSCYYDDDDADDTLGAAGFSSEDEFEEAGPPPPPSSYRKWQLCPDEKIDVGLGLTRMGAKIQINVIPREVIDRNDFFYICEECGKVYYDGTHFERVLNGKLKGVVQVQ